MGSLLFAELDAHGDLLQSLAWRPDGVLLGSSCKDKMLRIFDPRASPAACQALICSSPSPRAHFLAHFPAPLVGVGVELKAVNSSQEIDARVLFCSLNPDHYREIVQAHENGRDSRLVWADATNYLLSVGFNQVREREVRLWDTRAFRGSVASVTLDASPR
uniref:Uncharacterized protein n=1 Tax=Sphaerodactylus townsendi TaxID=933632 RepID=A0ACB8FK02_9SAUR